MSAESMGFAWLRHTVRNTFGLHDKIISHFFNKNSSLLTNFLNGKYISPMGVSNIAIYLEKRGNPYLAINQLNALAQVSLFNLKIMFKTTKIITVYERQYLEL